ncbi:unnamed protein product [Ambrosiozyma monospora]|uniref:Unnamed protein product n=1 Tax=Ambrosiozyma monospora TaxID=43982 RepID=A0A9W6WAE2_AMBMO|nr:unnamed protein product [Ambrosiozyma monospora]
MKDVSLICAMSASTFYNIQHLHEVKRIDFKRVAEIIWLKGGSFATVSEVDQGAPHDQGDNYEYDNDDDDDEYDHHHDDHHGNDNGNQYLSGRNKIPPSGAYAESFETVSTLKDPEYEDGLENFIVPSSAITFSGCNLKAVFWKYI